MRINNKVTFLELAAVILMAAILGISFYSGYFESKQYRTDKIIVAFGDSITEGYGVPSDKNYVSDLSKEVKIPIVNAGAIGDTTALAMLRLDKDVLSLHPDIVIVLLGGNDFIHGVSPFSIFDNMGQIIDRIQATGANVILIGISDKLLSDYENEFRRLSVEKKVAGYVPNVLGGIILRKDLMHDQIHPNALGHEIVASRILPVLEKVLSQ